ncbi:MAG: pirin family protein [Burkholderiaceae bacterium]|nr:pirin family protein [Burkholderiaceae bacterium]
MSVSLRLKGHEHDLGGGFIVRRLLPAGLRQAVGPILFFDHFGPVTIEPGKGNNVRPHPHIGLATVSYLFDGAILHRDSLGSVQRIEPGAINWMTAGSGIVHSEREPEDLHNVQYGLHGIQLWAALPIAHEETAPSFAHTAAADIPVVQIAGATIRVLIGSAFGATSPVKTFSETLYLDVALAQGGFTLPVLAQETAIYPLDGALTIDGETAEAGVLAVLHHGAPVQIASDGPRRFMVIGGEPLGSHRYMWWNFVSSRKERVEQAAADWDAQRMGKIEGDDEFIPLPPMKKS